MKGGGKQRTADQAYDKELKMEKPVMGPQTPL